MPFCNVIIKVFKIIKRNITKNTTKDNYNSMDKMYMINI